MGGSCNRVGEEERRSGRDVQEGQKEENEEEVKEEEVEEMEDDA